MSDIFKSATLNKDGSVAILRLRNSEIWRRAVPPHNEAELDLCAPELSTGERAAILTEWAGLPIPTPEPAPPITEFLVSFDAFEDRFTAQEWDDVTGYVYAVDTATGKPKRKALVQGLARAQARNSVDLLDPKTDAFLTLLVAGNVITTAKKTKILEP